MRISRIYCAQALSVGRLVDLPEAPARHIAQVLRLRAGVEVVLFDGTGGEYTAVLERVSRTQVQARVQTFVPRSAESNLSTWLIQGISRGERMDYTLQKAVELGVTYIVPVFSARCEVRLQDERLQRRWAHWRGVVIAACEQAGRTYVPSVEEPQELTTWLTRCCTLAGTHLLLSPHAPQGIRELPQINVSAPVTLLVGPEGGLNTEEIAHAQRAGYTPLRLGARILRTETAALAALAALQGRWGDF